MDHAELEQGIKGLVQALDTLRNDLNKKFDTVEIRFSQMHEDLKGLRNVLVDIGRFDEWRAQHEKVTDSILSRLQGLEAHVNQIAIHDEQVFAKASHNQRLLWALVAFIAGALGIAAGYVLHP